MEYKIEVFENTGYIQVKLRLTLSWLENYNKWKG